MSKPTNYTYKSAAELWEHYLKEDEDCILYEHSDPSWRHGEYRTVVVKDADGRFWMGTFTVSGDGEHHAWRDGVASDFTEVEPYTKTVTDYKAKVTTE